MYSIITIMVARHWGSRAGRLADAELYSVVPPFAAPMLGCCLLERAGLPLPPPHLSGMPG